MAAAEHLRDLTRLRQVRDRIARDFAEPLDVEALASSVDLSAVQLSLNFLRAYGESIHGHLMAPGIAGAVAMLRGELSVTGVCHANGCPSLVDYSTRLTRLGGPPPTAYHGHTKPLDAAIRCGDAEHVAPLGRNREAAATVGT